MRQLCRVHQRYLSVFTLLLIKLDLVYLNNRLLPTYLGNAEPSFTEGNVQLSAFMQSDSPSGEDVNLFPLHSQPSAFPQLISDKLCNLLSAMGGVHVQFFCLKLLPMYSLSSCVYQAKFSRPFSSCPKIYLVPMARSPQQFCRITQLAPI